MRIHQKLKVEGPYRRVSIPIYKYSSLIIVSGGIGVTPMQSIFDELMQYIQESNCIDIKRIHFVWCTKQCGNTLKEFDNLYWNVVVKHSEYDSNEINRQNLKFAEEIEVNDVVIM